MWLFAIFYITTFVLCIHSSPALRHHSSNYRSFCHHLSWGWWQRGLQDEHRIQSVREECTQAISGCAQHSQGSGIMILKWLRSVSKQKYIFLCWYGKQEKGSMRSLAPSTSRLVTPWLFVLTTKKFFFGFLRTPQYNNVCCTQIDRSRAITLSRIYEPLWGIWNRNNSRIYNLVLILTWRN